jgi:hypothetical protein
MNFYHLRLWSLTIFFVLLFYVHYKTLKIYNLVLILLFTRNIFVIICKSMQVFILILVCNK